MTNETAALLKACRICPRTCGVDRFVSTGYCGAPADLMINLSQLHFGEEPVLSGSRGSGTIFFAHCNLKCVFCQNHVISALGRGYRQSIESCAKLMLELQDRGAHNLNLVTPGHYAPQLKEALLLAKTLGLKLPVVWNTNAYETIETLQSLRGLIDIYLPDLKFAHGVYAKRYCNAPDYPETALEAISEMQAQVGDLLVDSGGIALRGLIIRLLVMPSGVGGVKANLIRIAEKLGTNVQLSLMAQYYPTHLANDYPEIDRGIRPEEYDQALEAAVALGFEHIFTQELSCSDAWTPKFKQEASL